MVQRIRNRIRARRRVPPGTLHTYDKAEPTRLYSIRYTDNTILYDAPLANVKDLERHAETAVADQEPAVEWLNVIGVHDGSVLSEIGGRYDIDSLILEDIQNTEHRPKLQEYSAGLAVILKMIQWSEEYRRIDVEQVTLCLSDSSVVSFQERPGDVFDPIRERIRTHRGRVRSKSANYLLYALLDTVIDGAFDAIERLQERIEEVEARIISEDLEGRLGEIFDLRGQVVELRRGLWPLREISQQLNQVELQAITPDLKPFLLDVHDHVLTLIDAADGQREQVNGLVQLHSAVLSTMQNQVMKTLTIIATIFIPLTFLAGIYGMNFQHMPELGWRLGYPVVLGAMALAAAGMVWWFRKRKWL